MPAQIDDTNYDIWLEHSSAKVPYRLARDENGNAQISTGSAPFASSQIFSGSFSLDNVNVNVNSPVAFQDWSGGAGFFEADLEDPVGKLVYNRGAEVDTSWPGVAYISPQLNAGSSTTQAATKFVYSSLGLFCMTARYVLEWTGAAWTQRLDTGGNVTNRDLFEFTNTTGTYLLLAVSDVSYYISTDGISWTQPSSDGAAPTFRSSATASTVGATSISIAAPAGLANNDIMLAMISTDAAETITPPSGFTQIASRINNTSHFLFYKRAASESGSYAFSWTTSARAVGTIAAFSGVAPTGTPYDFVSAANNSSGTTHLTGSGTIAGSNRTLVATYGASDDAGGSISWTAPAGYTERADTASGPSNSFNDDTTTTAGAAAAASSTSSAAGEGMGVLIALRPDTTGMYDLMRFASRGQASGDNLLWAVDSDGDIRNTADPTSKTAWSAADSIQMGEPGTIVGLEVVDNTFYLFTNKGITGYDGTTVSTVWANTNLILESNAARPYTWVDKAIYFTLSGTLFRYAADQLSIERVWPRSGQTGSSDLNGTITAITGDAANLWFVIKNAAGTSYVMKCNPYSELTYKGETFMPVHPLVTAGSTTVGGLIVVPGASDTLSTTNPQVVYANTTLASYFLLPTYNKEPKDDSNYKFTTAGGTLYGSWVRGAGKTFSKFLNRVTSAGVTMSASSYIATYYSKDYNETTQLVQTATTDGLSSTGLSSDVEFSNIRYVIFMDTGSTSTSPRLNAVSFDTSLNPNRMRQWELLIEIADDSERLGGGDSSYSSRYLDTHLFNGLTERVVFYDRLGNSFITRIVDITSQVYGGNKDVYKIVLVQLV